jgi:ferritin-like metal-binding protein YciE
MSLDTLQALFLEELKDVYHAEKQLVQALPKLARAAGNAELRQAFTSHLEETEGHVQRLEQIFRDLGETPKGKRCKGMAGLVDEGREIMDQEGDGSVIDAALIASAQRVEHYEIAAYGCLRTYAQLLGNDAAATLLAQTLSEEEAADEKLSRIAESRVNTDAAAAGARDAEAE